MKQKCCAVILLIFIPIINGHFGYSKREQHMWMAEFKSCSGKLQSPIALSSSKSISLPLPALEMIGYHDFLPIPIVIENNGHSVAISIKNKTRLPYIFGALLKQNQEYEMEGLHFHWGARNNRGSEHTLNGIRYPMEMHIIHRNRAYPNLTYALNYEDGLSVLGIFFQLQEEDNENLNPILNKLTEVRWINKKKEMNISLIVSSLMPNNIDVFFTYKGSLTTPPCNEVVTWIIFPSPVSISFRQMSKFRMLSNGEETLADNYRRLQAIGTRKIYVRRLKTFFMTKFNISQVNTTHTYLNWFWQ